MRALVYDTETTGLPLWSEPSEDPRQPHIVQLAALLVDLETRKTIASLDLIVTPTTWEIPAEVTALHGISTELAREVGVSECDALELFGQLWGRASVRIAHNESFDARILRIALMRYHGNGFGPAPDEWKAGRAECTQALATPILKLPPTEKMVRAGFNKYKAANLREAYKHFTGLELADAHSAMADALGCLAVYHAIKGRAAPAP